MNTSYWIITLKPESENVQELQQALKSQGLEANLFQAVDGRTAMPALEPGEKLAKHRTRLRHLCDLTPPEVGCYLSHLRLIKKAWNEGFESICILEDDVKLEPDFARIMGEITTLPSEVEMVRLMGLKIRKRKVVQPLGDGSHQLVRPERGWLGTQAYYLNRTGMEKVLKHASTIKEPIDKMYDHFWEGGLRLFGVEPHLVYEANTAPSSIAKSNRQRAKVPWFYYLLHSLEKGIFSVTRHTHLLLRRHEFYPATRPQKAPGQSARMRE